MSRNPRKAKYVQMPTCPLCNQKCMSLKLHNFCTCIVEPEDREPFERVINGRVVRDLVLIKEKIPELKIRYIAKKKGISVLDASVIVEVKKLNKISKPKRSKVSRESKNEFYASWEWKELRFKVLKAYGASCMLCGANNKESKICVDHIIPISLDWNKRLNPNNLQVLCNSCNMGKSNTDTTDFRVDDKMITGHI